MPSESDQQAQNTDHELWRERPGDYYSDSLFVTKGGSIGMNVGGSVVVRPIKMWFESVARISEIKAERNDLEIKHGLVIEAHKVTVSDLIKVEAERDALQVRVDELHRSMLLDGRFTSASVKAETIEKCTQVAHSCKSGIAVEVNNQQFMMGTQEGTALAIEAAIKALKPTDKP